MSCKECDEQHYVIDKLAKLLAEIAVIVNGPEPPLTRWSYHDLPEKVRALKQAPPAAAVPPGYALVPVEPTREMIFVGRYTLRVSINEPGGERARRVYLQMLASAERNGVGNG